MDLIYSDIVKEYNDRSAWGLSTIIDLKACNAESIRSPEIIKEYAIQLCSLIKMNRFQEAIIVNFGEDEAVAGYSLVQLIETSALIGHFSNLTNHAYIDLFSCKLYDPAVAAAFSHFYFGSLGFSYSFNYR